MTKRTDAVGGELLKHSAHFAVWSEDLESGPLIAVSLSWTVPALGATIMFGLDHDGQCEQHWLVYGVVDEDAPKPDWPWEVLVNEGEQRDPLASVLALDAFRRHTESVAGALVETMNGMDLFADVARSVATLHTAAAALMPARAAVPTTFAEVARG